MLFHLLLEYPMYVPIRPNHFLMPRSRDNMTHEKNDITLLGASGVNCIPAFFYGSIKSVPPPNPKKLTHLLKLWAYYGLSNPARKQFWALFSNEKTIIQKWEWKLAIKPAPTSFRKCLETFNLAPKLWAIYGLFRYATNDPSQTTPTKLLALKKIQKVSFNG